MWRRAVTPATLTTALPNAAFATASADARGAPACTGVIGTSSRCSGAGACDSGVPTIRRGSAVPRRPRRGFLRAASARERLRSRSANASSGRLRAFGG